MNPLCANKAVIKLTKEKVEDLIIHLENGLTTENLTYYLKSGMMISIAEQHILQGMEGGSQLRTFPLIYGGKMSSNQSNW